MKTFKALNTNDYYGEEEIYYSELELAEIIADTISEEIYDEMLDECYPEIEIMGMTFSPSVALYRLDEVAYNCGFNDYKDSMASDIAYELEYLGDGETYERYGFIVCCSDIHEKIANVM